jgi:hypothetical protein
VVGVLGDQVLGPVVCPNRLTGAVYHQWIGCGSLHDPQILILWIFGCGGHLKTLVFSEQISDLEVLQQGVQNTCQEIRVKPGIFERVHTSVRRRAESCVDMHGNHIQHLL